jgi:hypothetical protein
MEMAYKKKKNQTFNGTESIKELHEYANIYKP